MKTSHDLARELLAAPDLPVFHYDPSRDDIYEENDPTECFTKPTVDWDDDAVWIAGGGSVTDELGHFASHVLARLIKGRYLKKSVLHRVEQRIREEGELRYAASFADRSQG